MGLSTTRTDQRFLRRVAGRLPTPSITKRVNSALMRATGTFSLRYQLDAALHMPRMASVAMRASRSVRNSPLAMPSLMTSSKMRSSPRDQRPMRRRLSAGRCWRSLRNTFTKSPRSSRGDRCDLINKDRRSRAVPPPASDRLGGFEEALDALKADQLKCGFLGGKIVVEARLPDAQDVRNILCGGAVKAALGEDAGGRIDDLRRAAALARAAAGRGKSQNVHPDYSLIACAR